MEIADVAVVGGSLAGLQAALTLGRACRRVVLFDDARPRNAPAAHVHNFLASGEPTPRELLTAGRTSLLPYDVTVVDARVDAIRPVAADRFDVVSAGGSWSARAIVLATGLRDELPAVAGVADFWGRDVVACPHCHGWEVRGAPLAQLGMRGHVDRAVQRAVLLSRWSSDVILFTDGDALTAAHRQTLAAAGVMPRTEPVRRLLAEGGRLKAVELADGRAIPRRAVFVVVRQVQTSDLARQLGCDHEAVGAPAGAVRTDATGATSVPGVWAAGTTAIPALLAIGAAGHGSTVAVAVHASLTERDLAVSGRR